MKTARRFSLANLLSCEEAQHRGRRRVAGAEYVGLSRRRFDQRRNGVVQSFPIDISYYQGVEDGESWSEGGQNDSAYMSAMPAGRYVLRLEGQWEKWQQPQS
jgi:hypothetical protein